MSASKFKKRLRSIFFRETPIRTVNEAEFALRTAASPEEVRKVLRRVASGLGTMKWAAFWLSASGEHFDRELTLWLLEQNPNYVLEFLKRNALPTGVEEGLLEFLVREPEFRHSDIGGQILIRLIEEQKLPLHHPQMAEVVEAFRRNPELLPEHDIALAHPDLPVSLVRKASLKKTDGATASKLSAFMCEHGSDQEWHGHWIFLSVSDPRLALQALERLPAERKSLIAPDEFFPLLQSEDAEIRLQTMRHLSSGSHHTPAPAKRHLPRRS